MIIKMKVEMKMQIKYRVANSTDLDEVCELVNNAIDTMAQQNIFQWDAFYPTREDFLEDIDRSQLYVGLMDNRIAVVYVINQEYDEQYEDGNWSHKEEPFYIVHRLCVNPDFQNKGVAKNTLLHIEDELKSMDIHAIRLDVFSENPYALNLYNHLGYTKVGHAEWRKGRFYLMEKYFGKGES